MTHDLGSITLEARSMPSLLAPAIVAAIDPQPAPEPCPGPLVPIDAPITYPEFPPSGPVGPGK